MTLAAVGSVACFAGAGVLSFVAVRWPRQARTWDLLWLDTDDPLKRHCSGADSVRGSVVYEMYDDTGRCAYVGLALHFRQRAKAHGKDRKSDEWAYGFAHRVPWWRQSAAERELINDRKPYQNRTKGGSKRPTVRQVFRAWRKERA